MSGDNIELVRSICTDWERGDFGSADWADPNIEYVVADGPDPGSWHGWAAIAQPSGAWSDIRITAAEYRQLGDGSVLMLARNGGTGRASGLRTEMDVAAVFHVRGAKVTRLVFYWDRDLALADLGLEE